MSKRLGADMRRLRAIARALEAMDRTERLAALAWINAREHDGAWQREHARHFAEAPVSAPSTENLEGARTVTEKPDDAR